MSKIKKYTFSIGLIATSVIFADPFKEVSLSPEFVNLSNNHVKTEPEETHSETDLTILLDENEFDEQTNLSAPFYSFFVLNDKSTESAAPSAANLGAVSPSPLAPQTALTPLIVASALVGAVSATSLQIYGSNQASSAEDAIDTQTQTRPTPPPPPPPPIHSALIGGGITPDTSLAYTLGIQEGVVFTALPIAGIGNGEVTSVSINTNGNFGLIGLTTIGTGPVVYSVPVDISGPSQATMITGIAGPSFDTNVMINDLGTTGIVGIDDGSGTPHAFIVDVLTQSPTAISGLPSGKTITSVAINAAGDIGLIGGKDVATPNPFLSKTNGAVATGISLTDPGAEVLSVAIDQSGAIGIIGLRSAIHHSYVINLSSNLATPVNFSLEPSEIDSVAINRIGTIGLIGGSDSSNNAKAYSVDIGTNNATEITALASNATINSVALDNSGERGLLGGTTSGGSGIAYVVDVNNHSATEVSIPSPVPTSILSVEIQDFGLSGLIGGTGGADGNTAVVFLLPDLANSPTFALPINLDGATTGSVINSVSV
ncbi:MAG TPA: hypothetical protein VLE96_07180, partial [Chlamydiales bacterium]|nr:hypothetical protein [Chlamydiales bacterium]